MTGSRELAMTAAAICGYIDETLTKAATGDPDDLIHAAKHLLGIPAVRQSPFENERTCLLYFLSNYATATGDRDSTDDEVADAATLTDDEITDLCDYALDHWAFLPAREAIQRRERAIFGF
jgi:hypothetical protein